MLGFLATTENIIYKIKTAELTIAGKYFKKEREIVIHNFQIQNKTRVEPTYLEIGTEMIVHNYSS